MYKRQDLGWADATRKASERARLARIIQHALAVGRRPLVLRGAAAELAPIGRAVWNTRALPSLIPMGRVRVVDAGLARITSCMIVRRQRTNVTPARGLRLPPLGGYRRSQRRRRKNSSISSRSSSEIAGRWAGNESQT